MDAMLADYRMVEEVDAVRDAWYDLATALSLTLENRPGAGDDIAEAQERQHAAEKRARIEVQASLHLIQREGA
jgi:hypothetical protein